MTTANEATIAHIADAKRALQKASAALSGSSAPRLRESACKT